MRALREIVVVESLGPGARAARFRREGESLTRLGSADGRGDSREAAVGAALDALGGSRSTPVALVTLDAVAACLDLPASAASLAPERLAELVRWEVEPLVPGSGEVASAWARPEARGLEGGQAQGGLWLAVGVRRTALARWREALAGSRLEALYPRVLGALPLVGAARPLALLEVRPDACGAARVGADGVRSVRVRELAPGASLDGEAVLALLGGGGAGTAAPGASASVVHVSGDLAPGTREALARSGLDVRTLAPDVNLEGVARHALGLAANAPLAAIPAREPTPPLHREPWARALAAGLALVLALAAVDLLGLRPALAAARSEVDRLEARPRPLLAVAEPQGSRAELAAEVARLEAEDAALARSRTRLESEVLAHEAKPLALLDALARAGGDDEVCVERVAQAAPGQWKVQAFALSEAAAQRFAVALGRELAAAGLAAELVGDRSERGRLGVAGWTLDVRVGPAAPSPGAAPTGVVPAGRRRP